MAEGKISVIGKGTFPDGKDGRVRRYQHQDEKNANVSLRRNGRIGFCNNSDHFPISWLSHKLEKSISLSPEKEEHHDGPVP